MARRRRGKFLVAALVAAAAVAATCFVLTTPTTTTEAITRMPDLVGLELSVARTRPPTDLDIETVLVAGNEA